MTYLKVLSWEMILLLLAMTSGLVSAGEPWGNNKDHHLYDNLVEGRAPNSHVSRLDVVCSKDHMTVNMFFDSPFYGVVFSHSNPHHERCVHVGPRAGVKEISFHIRYDSCGTVEDLSGQFHENTIVIQYGEDILEAWDEAKRLRCEWLESFDKQSSKPTLAISDIEVVELNFQGDDIDCWMEVQEGKGPWARQVGGLVPIGSPLTLVIAVNDNSREFDMRVKQCTASDGSGSEIQLTDQSGCVLRPSLITPFAKVRDFGGKATLVAYSHIFAFKFPDLLDVYVHCIVEVCRHGCPDSCGGHAPTDYHTHLKENLHSLESKKHQKLVELTKSKPPTEIKTVHHNVKVPHQHQRPQYLTQIPAHILQKSKSGGGTFAESLLLAEQRVHQSFPKNASTSFINKDTPTVKHATVGRKFQGQTDEANLRKKHKSDIQSSASTVHAVSGDAKSHTHHGYHGHSDVKPVPIGHYHRIIGHDAHWNSEEVKIQDEQHLKHHIPPFREPVLGIPQPEPSAWSADEVRPLTKDEVFHPHTGPKLIHHPTTHLENAPLRLPPVPQPEPAAWSADEVRPLTKQEVFRPPHISDHHIAHFKEELGRLVSSKEIFDDHKHHNSHFPSLNEPKPEPSPWTYEEVGPMHNPGLVNLHLEKERLQEPKPEPAPWSADDVKPLTKEDLKAHSLNCKLKSHPHLLDSLPIYKESVHPHLNKPSSPAPVPVYVPKYTSSPPNMSMSGPMMMKMMMMMPTILPFTYQTARWPQRATTARHLNDKQHYPYPIPQFTHQQQRMMSVIADRRMDGDDDDLQFELDPRSNLHLTVPTAPTETDEHLYVSNSPGTTDKTGAINEETTVTHRTSVEPEDDTLGTSNHQTQTTNAAGDHKEMKPTPYESRSNKDQGSDSFGSIRPPVAGFVPPSLDIDESNKSKIKDRFLHAPRALNRRKRSSEPVFGVRQKFQAIALSDLAFELNLTRDSTAVFRGRREEIIYGICMSPASMSAGVGFILILILCSLIASLVLYEHSWRLKNKTSHLSLLTRTFNGRLESLYKISRPHPNSSVREIG